MKRALALLLLALAAALGFPAATAHAQIELAEANPPEGAILNASPDGGTVAEDAGDDGPDILFLALITTASAGGAALLFTLGYFLRRRIGYEPHRPPEGGEECEGH